MTPPNPQHSSLEEKLRYALAVNRGMRLMNRSTPEGAALAEKINALPEGIQAAYNFIHRQLFQDWQRQPHLHRPGRMNSAAEEIALRPLLAALVAALRYPSGQYKTLPASDVAQILAAFYTQAIQREPYAYGNRTTLDCFLVALLEEGRQQGVEGYGGLDFRRLTDAQKTALHQRSSSVEVLQDIFTTALNPSLTPRLQNTHSEFREWPDQRVVLRGIPFLSVERGQASQSAFPLPLRERVNDECGSTSQKGEGLSPQSLSPHPDSQALALLAGESCPLPQGERDLGHRFIVLTNGGLMSRERFEAALETHLQRDVPFADFEPLLPEAFLEGFSCPEKAIPLCLDRHILTGLRDDEALRFDDTNRITQVTQQALQPVMNAAIAEAFTGKTPAQGTPQFFMTQGGASAGKSAIVTLAQAECGDNFVITSLDAFREKSALYQVLRAANYHADDYALIEPFANALRDAVAERALAGGYHLLYDGTGIPYHGRYDRIAAQFKQRGYHTTLGAVEARMEVAAKRVEARFDVTKRAVPWSVFFGKHIDFPAAFMQAVEDENLDAVLLFENDREGEEAQLIASMGGAGFPKACECFFSYEIGGKPCILTIYDTQRFTLMQKKAQKNRHASTLAGLSQPIREARFAARVENAL